MSELVHTTATQDGVYTVRCLRLAGICTSIGRLEVKKKKKQGQARSRSFQEMRAPNERRTLGLSRQVSSWVLRNARSERVKGSIMGYFGRTRVPYRYMSCVPRSTAPNHRSRVHVFA